MIIRPLLLAFFCCSLIPVSAAPEIFSDPRLAIEAARKEKRLIIFFLADSFSEESKAMEKAVLEQVAGLENEFVIVRCDMESRSDRSLFEERFEKDLKRAPMAVVSDSQGKEITGCYGTSSELYRKMLIHSRIKGGFVKDKDQIALLQEELIANADEEDLVKGIFGIKVSDLRKQKVLLTAQRPWLNKDGSTFQAALLEGRGATGIFVDGEGKEIEIQFADLAPLSIEFLKTVLTVQKTDAPSN